MRFMILVKASAKSEAGEMPGGKLLAAMADYHEQLARAGVLLDGSGLQPTSKGWRIRYHGNGSTIVDGPFTETKELVAGYTIIQTRDVQEALEWTRRFPNPQGEGNEGEIEVRRMYELDDFAPSEEITRFRAIDTGEGPGQ